MPWILLRLGRHEQQFGGPAQPNDPIGAFVEDGENRHLLPLVILAMIIPFEAVVGARKQFQIAPAAIRCEGRNPLDRCLGYGRDVHPPAPRRVIPLPPSCRAKPCTMGTALPPAVAAL